MPTTTEAQATVLAFAPSSGDGASSGLPSRKEGQAECLPEEWVAAESQQLNGTAGLLDEPTAMPTTTEVPATVLAFAPTSGDGASSGLPSRKEEQLLGHEHAPSRLRDPFLLSTLQNGRILPRHARSMVPSARNCAALS